jgi:hypothetical protein
VIQAFLTEVMGYPAPPGQLALATSDGPQRYATPLQIETRLGTVLFLNTTTVFWTPTEVTLSELASDAQFKRIDLGAQRSQNIEGKPRLGVKLMMRC